ncbi:hypothetical protein ACIBVL_15195 [Streptomyces sp. NPDC049687]|uniref:hypothetical protein n=1 Tax=Streptomyces sp. NPDC049687 TaxID=3365596 RepID=UPI0037895222
MTEQALTDAAETLTDAHDTKLRTEVADVTDSARVKTWVDGVTADPGRLDRPGGPPDASGGDPHGRLLP